LSFKNAGQIVFKIKFSKIAKKGYLNPIFISVDTNTNYKFMVFKMFNATYINISVISRQSVLLVEEIGVPRENHRLVANH